MKTIRIETAGSGHTGKWRVFLNDQDISQFVQTLFLEAPAYTGARVHLTLVGNIEIPDELEAIVTATIEDQEEA